MAASPSSRGRVTFDDEEETLKKHESRGKVAKTAVTFPSTRARTTGANLSTLEPIEEKVIRMLHGLSEDDDTVLEYAVGASADARQRMALMEACNVAELDGDVPLGPEAQASGALLGAIVQRYHGYGE